MALPTIYRTMRQLPEAAKGAVVAIGNFDGLHAGHQAVLRQTMKIAKELGAPSGLVSFYPHPRHYFNPSASHVRLQPFRHKVQKLGRMGIDTLYLMHFTETLATLPADRFVSEVLHQQMQVRHVVVGDDFIYGFQRGGNTETLKRDASHHDIGVSVMDAVRTDGERYSSTAIRDALQQGKLAVATHMLGHPPVFIGRIVHGEKRGRTIGVPTANMRAGHFCPPAYGVYAVRVHIEDATYNGVANIGLRPTVDGQEPRLEAHLFDCDAELYGKRMEVELLTFLRPEERFDGLDALKAQIAIDITHAKAWFDGQKEAAI